MSNETNSRTKEHWEKVYSSKETTELGWYEEVPQPSLDLIAKCAIGKDERALVVGVGVSTLIERLVDLGYGNIIALDISPTALEKLKRMLGEEKSKAVTFVEDDITAPSKLTELENVSIWQDRAMLHFLTDEKSRSGYLNTLKRTLAYGGYAIIACFSPDGARKCSGLDIVNYDHNSLERFLGEEFELLEHFYHTHATPSGAPRPYVYTLFRKSK